MLLFVHGYGMDCTYIGHSTFLLETEHVLLLFDYTGGPLEIKDEKKSLLVFSSHRHADHFNESIFSLARREGNTVFILSSDIATHLVPQNVQVRWMGPYEEVSIDEAAVRTLKSTDEGVAFVLQVDGKTIYYAGDLNHWHWEGESEAYNLQMKRDYYAELRLLPAKLDIAFVPVDPRLGPFYSLGAKDLVERVKVKTLIPMHFWKDHSVCEKLKTELKDTDVTVVQLTHEIQTWRIL